MTVSSTARKDPLPQRIFKQAHESTNAIFKDASRQRLGGRAGRGRAGRGARAEPCGSEPSARVAVILLAPPYVPVAGVSIGITQGGVITMTDLSPTAP